MGEEGGEGGGEIEKDEGEEKEEGGGERGKERETRELD